MSATRLRAACLTIVVCAAGCGFQQEHYETAAIARTMGAGERGLLPAFVPESASTVHIVNEPGSGGVWIWCYLDRPARAQLEKNVHRTAWSSAAADTSPPPFGFSHPSWNPILGGTPMYTPPSNALYFLAGSNGEWHGIVDPSGKCWITRRRA